MLDLAYSSLRAFARDCRACGYSTRLILESGEFLLCADGAVIVS